MTEPCATQSTRPAADPQEDPLRFPSASTAAVWSPIDRWEWAATLPVSGIARAVANCIARHANNLTGLAWPGFARIVEETGFKRRAVILATQELERGGHLTVSRVRVGGKNKSNRYQLPPMGGGAPHALGSAPRAPGGAPHALGGSAPHAPESVSLLNQVKELVSSSIRRARTRKATAEDSGPERRLSCETCGNTWPAKYGDTCFQCTPRQRRYAAQEKRNRISEGKAPIPEEDPAPEERPEPEEDLGSTRTKEPEAPKVQVPEGPESAREALGDAAVDDLAWRDRLDKIETPSFSVRRFNQEGALAFGVKVYTFPDGSRLLTYRSRWHHGVHTTRLKDPETLSRYTGHQIATAWLDSASYGLTEEDAGPAVAQKETGFAPISPRLPRAFAELRRFDSVSAALSRVQPETPDSRLTV